MHLIEGGNVTNETILLKIAKYAIQSCLRALIHVIQIDNSMVSCLDRFFLIFQTKSFATIDQNLGLKFDK